MTIDTLGFKLMIRQHNIIIAAYPHYPLKKCFEKTNSKRVEGSPSEASSKSNCRRLSEALSELANCETRIRRGIQVINDAYSYSSQSWTGTGT